MKPAKVAFLLNEFPTLTETFILNQIVFLIRRGVDVRIFAMYPGDFSRLHSQYRGFGLEEKLTVVGTLPSNWKDRFKEAWYFFKKHGFFKHVLAFFKTTNPFNFGFSSLKLTQFLFYCRLYETQSSTLVHAHFGEMGHFFSKFVNIGLLNRRPFLVSFHGYDLVPTESEVNRHRYQSLFKTGKVFTVNSNYTGRLLQCVGASIQSRVRLLPESLDTRLFEKKSSFLSAPNGKFFRLVFVGRLVEWKGPDTAISIVDKIIRDFGIADIELSIIGRGPMFSDLEKMVEEKGLADHVKLLGGQEQSKLKSILSEADLFIYTGRTHHVTQRAENQGLVLMEAQAMGLPVVAFDVGGVGEGVDDGVTGHLVPQGEIAEFAGKIVELLLDGERRAAMGEAARAFICDSYDIDVLGERLLEIYSEVLS